MREPKKESKKEKKETKEPKKETKETKKEPKKEIKEPKKSSSASKRTRHQKDRLKMYQGEEKVHSSHIISAKERKKFDLANYRDRIENYRNQLSSTNQSVHTVIDNYLMSQNKNKEMQGGPLPSSKGVIPKSQIKKRIEMKIEIAKLSGDIKNKRFNSYLKKAAKAYDVDMRCFNGN